MPPHRTQPTPAEAAELAAHPLALQAAGHLALPPQWGNPQRALVYFLMLVAAIGASAFTAAAAAPAAQVLVATVVAVLATVVMVATVGAEAPAPPAGTEEWAAVEALQTAPPVSPVAMAVRATLTSSFTLTLDCDYGKDD